MQKALWRIWAKQKIASLDEVTKSRASFLVNLHLEAKLFDWSKVGVYFALPDEVQLSLKGRAELFCMGNWSEEKGLEFYQGRLEDLKKETCWQKDFFVMPENKFKVTPEILLIPGLAFDQNGVRLGRGKGYFDRYLEKFSGLKIGVGFEACVVPALPYEKHDIQMDWIVSECGIRKLKG